MSQEKIQLIEENLLMRLKEGIPKFLEIDATILAVDTIKKIEYEDDKIKVFYKDNKDRDIFIYATSNSACTAFLNISKVLGCASLEGDYHE